MRLNPDQFHYHLAPQEARGSIEQHGIDYRQGKARFSHHAGGNFFLTDEHEARAGQANERDFHGKDMDLWQARIDVPTHADPEGEEMGVPAVYTKAPIPPHQLKRLG